MYFQVLFDIIAWFSMRPGTENKRLESGARAGMTIVAPTWKQRMLNKVAFVKLQFTSLSTLT